MSHGTVREYVVRLRRLGQHLTTQDISRSMISKNTMLSWR
jgi:FliZ protein